MRLLSFLIAVALGFNARANTCPTYLQANPQALKAMEFVNKFKGTFTLGSCQIEILTCEGWEDTEHANPVAEILVTEKDGREVYATMVFPKENNELLRSSVEISKRVLHFEKRDRFYEPEFGRTEYLRLEFNTEWSDLSALKSLEIGTYSTNKALHSEDGNQSRWYICRE